MAGRSKSDEDSIFTSPAIVDDAEAEVALFSSDGGVLRWRPSSGGSGGRERSLTVESEVLGFEMEGANKIVIRAFAEDVKGVSCVGIGGGGGDDGKKVRRDVVVEFPSEVVAAAWADKIRNCIESLGRPRRLFILVNPYGGKKCARNLFDSEIKPLLDAADILYTLQETNHQLHAQEIARSLDLLKYDGIVCVSGDGVLVEVVNGLLQRDDWHSAIKVPLGIIPAGTGNGMAKSLSDSTGDLYSVSNATFAVIRGHRRSLDVVTVSQGERKFFSVLMLAWGLISDIDIESEKYRWMGSARLDFYCLLRVINLRKYHGQIHFVPAPGYEDYGEPTNQDNVDRNGSAGIAYCNGKSGNYQGSQATFQDSDWRSLDGPFILLWVNNVPWASEGLMPAPEAKFADGYMDVLILRNCPKSALVSFLLKMNNGSHVKSPYAMYLKVKAFHLKPGQRVGSPSKGGIIDSDGEVIARGEGTYNSHKRHEDLMSYGPPIQMTVDQGLAAIFSPR